MAQERPRGPIFIVGPMGSGTTLLRLILDSHPDLAIAQETTFMRAVLAHKWIPFWLAGGEWFQRIGYTEEELDEELRAFYDRVFTRFAQAQGASRWGDKSPHHVWHLLDAARIFPDAVFIATVRHPGAVASSLHYRFRWRWAHAVNHWMRGTMEITHRARDLGDRMLVCRYEDLVLDVQTTMREVLDFIGAPWSDSVVEHHVVHGERAAPVRVEGKTVATDPIDAARVTKWAATMPEAGFSLLRKRAAPLARFYGYDIDRPAALDPLPPAGASRAKVISGAELTRRRDDFPDVDWSYRPKPSAANQRLKPSKFTVVPATARPKDRVARRELEQEKLGRRPPKSARRSAAGARTGRPGGIRDRMAGAARAAAARLPAAVLERVRRIIHRGR